MEEGLDFQDIQRRFDGALEALKAALSGLRAGRAHPSLLDSVMVEAYGSLRPVKELGALSVPESRLLCVSVWDKSIMNAVEKAIRNANLGVNPIIDGAVIRLPIPPTTQEQRQKLIKLASQRCEEARVAIRNIRRDGMETLKKLEKDAGLGKDEKHAQEEKLQKIVDEMIKKVDALFVHKESEISKV